ncbi:glutathione S-transferase family protein [Vibrio parahaemolyticus]
MNKSLSEMGTITLISYEICPFVQRATIALELMKQPYEIKHVDLANKPEWFSHLSPTGKVPILQLGETVLFESQVIVEFLLEAGGMDLQPTDLLHKAHQRALIEYSSNVIFTQWQMCTASSKEEMETYKQRLGTQLTYLESQLKVQELDEYSFFDGNSFQLIDLCFAPLLQRLLYIEQDYLPNLFDNTPRLKKWAQSLSAYEAVVNTTPPQLQTKINSRITSQKSFIAQ